MSGHASATPSIVAAGPLAACGILSRMGILESTTITWELARNADEVHALLVASDEYAATKHELPAPTRNMSSTTYLVDSGYVHAGRRDGALIGMFTLTPHPPRGAIDPGFPSARDPRYLQRFAIRPDHLGKGSVVGAQCLRTALEVATAAGADVLRAETNPDLTAITGFLQAFGFVQYGAIVEGVMRRVYLEKRL